MRGFHRGLLLALVVAGPAPAGVPAGLDLPVFAEGLSNPVALRHAADGSGQVHVVQQGGVIRTFAADGSALQDLLSLTADPPLLGFTTGGERGLLGLAFHPDFPGDPRAFVYYTDGFGDSVVASYETAGTPPVADPASQQIVLRVDQDSSNHNGGDIHFGADGYLYVALGDGGGANDTCNRAQSLDPAELELGSGCGADAAFTGDSPDSLVLLGKLLRIDVDATTPAGGNGLCGGNDDGSANYAVPPSNPFAGGGTADGCDEIWHYGLRNPYRFSFDRLTGDLFIGDVGQGAWEEIDFAPVDVGGRDFGWRPCEGRFERGSTSAPCSLPGATLPILDYGRSGGACAVTGGFRYRGPIAALEGDYVYADYCNGRIYIASEDAGTWTPVLWRDTSVNITGFGEDEAGDLYLTGFDGRVYRFELPSAHVAVADAFGLDEDSGPAVLDVLANDSADATLASVSLPVLGTASLAGSAVSFTPLPDACGTGGFSYALEGGSSAIATVDIACVEDGNAVATDDQATVAQDGSVLVDVLANDGADPDPEQNPVAVVAAGPALQGSVSLEAGQVRYTPAPAYCGVDGFQYTLQGGSNGTVRVVISCASGALVFRDGFE